ncbi:hypothetical protein [Nocardioides astragali]|uniref:Secreted protein n=1 Tax=Nocardioides astragali TaxID=1776736 RepID=A0ABW2MYH4_9ACTN|nr:hypothetical protein [Nocardioides astragali]
MSVRELAVLVVTTGLLLSGSADPSPRPGRTQARDLDLVASAQPSPLRLHDRDSAVAEVAARGGQVKADAVATTATTCAGCRGESTTLQVVYVMAPGSARLDNVASAWTQDCWDCTATALSVQLVVVGKDTRARPSNRALAVGEACATCRTATAAFQLVVQVPEVGPLPDNMLDEVRAWMDAEDAALRAAVAAGAARRGAERAATRALLDLRGMVVAELDGRTLSARAQVTR